MTKDKQRKRAAREYADEHGQRYVRALRDTTASAPGAAGHDPYTPTDPGSTPADPASKPTVVGEVVAELSVRLSRLSGLPPAPIPQRCEHSGQCLESRVYFPAIGQARTLVSALGDAAVLDEESVGTARRVLGALAQAHVVACDDLAVAVAEAGRHARVLLELVEAAHCRSCELSQQLRMPGNAWFRTVTGLSQRCAPGRRDVVLSVRHDAGVAVMMPSACVDHAAEELVTWTDIPAVTVELTGCDTATTDLVTRKAARLREVEHWLLGFRWWTKEHDLAPRSPFTDLLTGRVEHTLRS
ncbi:hypothetical protein [Nocardia thailandica]